MATQYEHAVSFINGTTVTEWATFMIRDATTVRFFDGVAVSTVATHASAPTITTAIAHGFSVGDKVAFQGVRSVAPDINAASETALYTVASAPTSTTFTIAENVTTAGAGGYVGKLAPGYLATEQVASIRVGEFTDRRTRDNKFY
jgi:hypothetical protein